MNTLSIIGAFLVTLALISYSIGILSEQFKRKLIPRVMFFVSLGVVLDISATALMILGSRNSPFTLHGFVGYSALLLMLVEVFGIWKLRVREGKGAEVPGPLHLYSRIAYIWWVIAYFTGTYLAMT
ncbi:MAG: hypothetical protein R2751_08640 [Bacteroidales bacterium]